MQEQWSKPTRRYCHNCGKIVIGFRSEKGVVKLECRHCGLVMISKRMSRRHERVDVIPPTGEYIDN